MDQEIEMNHQTIQTITMLMKLLPTVTTTTHIIILIVIQINDTQIIIGLHIIIILTRIQRMIKYHQEIKIIITIQQNQI
jgi:hypothetical protein